MPSASGPRVAALMDALRGVGTVQGLLDAPHTTPQIQPTPGADEEAQTEAIAGLQAQVAALEARLAALEGAPPPDLSAYATKAELEAVSTELTAVSDDLTTLEARVDALEAPPAP